LREGLKRDAENQRSQFLSLFSFLRIKIWKARVDRFITKVSLLNNTKVLGPYTQSVR